MPSHLEKSICNMQASRSIKDLQYTNYFIQLSVEPADSLLLIKIN